MSNLINFDSVFYDINGAANTQSSIFVQLSIDSQRYWNLIDTTLTGLLSAANGEPTTVVCDPSSVQLILLNSQSSLQNLWNTINVPQNRNINGFNNVFRESVNTTLNSLEFILNTLQVDISGSGFESIIDNSGNLASLISGVTANPPTGGLAPAIIPLYNLIQNGLTELSRQNPTNYLSSIVSASNSGNAAFSLIINDLIANDVIYSGTESVLALALRAIASKIVVDVLRRDFHFVFKGMGALVGFNILNWPVANPKIVDTLNKASDSFKKVYQYVQSITDFSGTNVSSAESRIDAFTAQALAQFGLIPQIQIITTGEYRRFILDGWNQLIRSIGLGLHDIEVDISGVSVPLVSDPVGIDLYRTEVNKTINGYFRQLLLDAEFNISDANNALGIGYKSEANNLVNTTANNVLSSLTELMGDLYDDTVLGVRILDYIDDANWSSEILINKQYKTQIINNVFNTLFTLSVKLVCDIFTIMSTNTRTNYNYSGYKF
jgi:hypothetical protein